MYFIESVFDDFEPFSQAALMWNLDFRLLSKNDFSAYLGLCSTPQYQISRTKLNGKIEQIGQCPVGFRTIVIPTINSNNFIWLNRKTNADQLLIFPKNGILDGVSYDHFDVYIISIEESFLFETINNLGFLNVDKYFDANEKTVDLSDTFITYFHSITNKFFDRLRPSPDQDKFNSNRYKNLEFEFILGNILKYLDNQKESHYRKRNRKRDRALNKAIDLINRDIKDMPTLSQLCEATDVSARTLEYAFFEKFQVTPSNYLKALKLNKVKNKLLLSENEDLTISQLAVDYGFWHMGQFAEDYKKWFGELPSVTLKRNIKN